MKKILLALLIVFIALQFFQPARNTASQETQRDITNIINVPANVQRLLKNSCYDCHSNNTRYPWYAKIQPIGWLLAKHIKDGKADLNFNEFASYSQRRRVSKLKSIRNSIQDGSMPLASYTLLHSNTKLSEESKALIIGWTTKVIDSLTNAKKVSETIK